MASIPNVKSFSDKDLAKLLDSVNTEMKKRQSDKKTDTITKIQALAQDAGISVNFGKDAAMPKKKTSKVKAKYRHPDDSKVTWSGRGRKPNWLQQLVEQGSSIDDFLI